MKNNHKFKVSDYAIYIWAVDIYTDVELNPNVNIRWEWAVSDREYFLYDGESESVSAALLEALVWIEERTQKGIDHLNKTLNAIRLYRETL